MINSGARGAAFELPGAGAGPAAVEDDLYSGFNDVAEALDARRLREDEGFQEALRTAGGGGGTRRGQNRMGTALLRPGTVSLRLGTGARTSTAATAAGGARPMTAVRAAGYTSAARSTPTFDEKKEETIEDKIKHLEQRIMTLIEESCALSVREEADWGAEVAPGGVPQTPSPSYDLGKGLAKAQEASSLERQLIRMQEQANLGDSHNLDLTFAVLCNLAGQYALSEMYTEALNTYQLLTRNKLFPHANRLKVNMGNIYFKMGDHPKALKLYRMALDQTPTAEKDLRMKVMHNIGLLLVRMGKFRDAVGNFQHIMHEQGDFQTGLHLVLCSVALNDVEGGKAAFHAMLDVEPPTHHQDIVVDDESDAYEAVLRDVVRGDRLARWSRRAAGKAERCLVLAAAALAPLVQPAPATPADRRLDDIGMWWCVEALRGWEAGGAGARLELGAALAALRAGGAAAGAGVARRLRAVARAHQRDRLVRAEANADAAFVAYALGNYSEAQTLADSAARDDPYGAAARVTAALAAAAGGGGGGWPGAAERLAAAAHLDPANLHALHDLALALAATGRGEEASARWVRLRSAGGAGGTLRTLAAARLGHIHHEAGDSQPADHWYGSVGAWDAGVASALARLHAELGDTTAAKHHYQDVEAVWPCDVEALAWLGAEARGSDPALAAAYYRRAARLQPNNPQWGLQLGGCLRGSGRYQDALALYKNMNQRFPDNVQCLKLIVKLCGDQGLPETTAWGRELQRAQARVKQQERAALPSASSGSSRTSQSPGDPRPPRTDSGLASAARSQLSTASSGLPTPGPHPGRSTLNSRSLDTRDRSAERRRAGSALLAQGSTEGRVDEADELPLPPE